MKTTMRQWWWVSALLVMVVEGHVSVDPLTDAGTEAVRLVREDFHKSIKIKKAFQVLAIVSTEYKEHSDGTFVEVKFTMKQTNCRKHKWMNQDCTPKKGVKKTYNCLGCFKFSSSRDLLETGYKKCVRQRHAKTKEVRKERNEACAKLKEDPHIYHVGVYSFRRAHRGQHDY